MKGSHAGRKFRDRSIKVLYKMSKKVRNQG